VRALSVTPLRKDTDGTRTVRCEIDLSIEEKGLLNRLDRKTWPESPGQIMLQNDPTPARQTGPCEPTTYYPVGCTRHVLVLVVKADEVTKESLEAAFTEILREGHGRPA